MFVYVKMKLIKNAENPRWFLNDFVSTGRILDGRIATFTDGSYGNHQIKHPFYSNWFDVRPDMVEVQLEQVPNLLIDGKQPIYHAVMDRNKFGLSEEEARQQDMADEYAVIADEKANAGIIVYGKYGDVWRSNPWSTRFLIKVLLESRKISFKQPTYGF